MAKKALISVSDRTGITGFAQRLATLGYEIVSTGGTASAISRAGVPVTEVKDLTGFPECLNGRVKTLHPKIHGGLLAIRSNDDHMAQMRKYGVEMIDLVAVNLYPFKKTIERPGTALEEAIEEIDIGGPAMLRSAAKNYRDVTVVVDPADYEPVLHALEQGGEVSPENKFRLALKVFEHTANYDAMIAGYLASYAGNAGGTLNDGSTGGRLGAETAPAGADGASGGADAELAPDDFYFPDKLTLTYEIKQRMRYGENPHQAAAFYTEPIPAAGSLATYAQLHGKELSYNNIGDLDGALSLLAEFTEPAAIAVKHANPCGAAVAKNLYDAYMKAYESDTTSIYGGIIALNRVVDAATAAEINKIFIEIVAAPGYDDGALKILKRKKNIRLLEVDTPAAARAGKENPGVRALCAPATADGAICAGAEKPVLFIKKVGGGLLAQSEDNMVLDEDKLVYVTVKKPSERELSDLIFAMAVVKHTKSNAIVLVKDNATVGVGPGQNSRIMAAKIAIEVAADRSRGSVAASDALFPFDDCVEAFAAAGVTAIIQPGGGRNDAASIEACDRHGIAMVFTGFRHFWH